MTNYSNVGAHWALLSVLALAGCSGEAPTGGANSESGTEDIVSSLGPAFVDAQGRTWENEGFVNYSKATVNDRVITTAAENTDEKIMKMSLEEAAEYLRPVTEIGHYQYRLSKAEAIEFAKTVRESIASKALLEAPATGADGAATDREGRAIIPGFGDWYRINSSAHLSPYSYVASMDQGAGLCTGEKLINNYTAVTAAHCVQDSSGNWMARQRLRFRAGSANTAYGGTGAALAYVPSGCYARTVPGCWTGVGGTCDYAVLALRTFAGAWCDLATYNVGNFGYLTLNNEASGVEARMATYPGSPPTGTYPSLFYHNRPDAETQNNAWLYYHNDTLGGSSGGPVYNSSNQMRATHVGYLSGNWNIGMRLTSTVITFFQGSSGS
ncbi:MAG TPA: trypsin-like peptidase domain-containing protein [Polyangiaceae bacterium]|nr:trypsin-like peptidase domain-containing protein [Polyangiaceae bacterium]